MEFDIIQYTAEELAKLSNIQMQLLRSAQKSKNQLKHKLEQDVEMFKKLVLTDGMKNSSLIGQKRAELLAEYDREVGILAEQLDYSMGLSEPYPDRGDEGDGTGYIVDYTLTYTDRYVIVRDYYLAIPDPAERMALYSNDDVAKKYLGSYYATLYNVLNTYSM